MDTRDVIFTKVENNNNKKNPSEENQLGATFSFSRRLADSGDTLDARCGFFAPVGGARCS